MAATQSVYWDGKISIEHQISIHVKDLMQCDASNVELVFEVLTGLQYVLDYRLRGRKQHALEGTICDQLVRALLLFTGGKRKTRDLFNYFDRRRPSDQADLAFTLLADFCVEVRECSVVLQSFTGDGLGERLLLGQRILRPSSAHVLGAALSLLRCISMAHDDWRDFVHHGDIDEVEELLRSKRFFDVSTDIIATNAVDIPLRRVFPPPALYFDRSGERVLDMFGISLETGLDDQRVGELRSHYGSNDLPRPAGRSVLRMLLAQVLDFMVLVLLAAAIVSAVLDYPKMESALILLSVVLLNIAVGFWQEYKSTKTLAAMNSLQIPVAKVRRNGVELQVPAPECVPGDLVFLGEGDYVPADLRLIQCSTLEIRETILTGESEGVSKSTAAIRIPSRRLQITKCTGNAFMGTMVTRGTAVGVVVRTGIHTEIGTIGSALAAPNEGTGRSPLQRRMVLLGRALVAAALVLCVAVLGIGLLQGRSVAEMSRLSISLAVSVIPEGLVAILTVSMALAVRRLAKQQILVCRLNVVETMGSATVIAADKTGTLTEGRMRLESVWTLALGSASDELVLHEVCTLCNNATLSGTGEPTELALLEGCVQRSVDVVGILAASRRLAEIPFDSDRRMMSVLVERSQEMHLDVKGAVEAILSRTTRVMIDGEELPITADHLETILAQEDRLSASGLRVLAVARKRMMMTPMMMTRADADWDLEPSRQNLEKELCFIGLVGLVDPPRPGVAESIQRCQQAGINVIMITGDNTRTAVSIATLLGIHNAGVVERSRVIKGTDLDLLTPTSLASLSPFPSVFARVSPANKLAIVRALKMRGEVVAMTGDGVNDAPAIGQADIGIAMGRGGTQITREAASLILLDDNFTVITKAIAQGRLMTLNISLFIVYLLSCNSAEIWTVLGAMLLGWKSPLTPMGILWANIIADIPPSMSLSLERESEAQLMRTHCRIVPKILLGPATWILIAVNGVVLSLSTILVYGVPARRASLAARRSEAYLVLIGLQLVLALFSRSNHQSVLRVGVLGNKALLASVAFSFACLVAGIYVPWMASMLELEPVSWPGWLKFAGSAAIMLLSNELAKLCIRRIFFSSPSSTPAGATNKNI